jgi:hypothetical protein
MRRKRLGEAQHAAIVLVAAGAVRAEEDAQFGL